MSIRRFSTFFVVIWVLILAAITQGFFLAPCTRSATTLMQAQASKQSQNRVDGGKLDRLAALQQGAFLSSAFLFLTASLSSPAQAKNSAPAASFEECISRLLLSRKVLEPVQKYIKIGQYDPARTNIKYVTNQFRLKKAMERVVLLAFEKDLPQSKLDDAAEVRPARMTKQNQ